MRPSVVFGSVLFLGACGGNTPPPSHASQTPVEAPETYEAPQLQGEIERADLTGVLELGLPRFLRGIITEPHLEDGTFVGHRIVQMYPDDPRFSQLDLQPGDTVVRINGQSVERPEQAYEVWTGLRVSSQLLVDYLHDGEERQLRFGIVD